jgi:hypothetical protein
MEKLRLLVAKLRLSMVKLRLLMAIFPPKRLIQEGFKKGMSLIYLRG